MKIIIFRPFYNSLLRYCGAVIMSPAAQAVRLRAIRSTPPTN